MLLLHLFGLALLASKHVASLPTEVGFPLSERDDDCGGDLSKRAPCTQPVQCGTNQDSQGAQVYSTNTIKNTVTYAKSSFPDKKGTINGYPKYYGQSDTAVRNALPSDCVATGVKTYEFPIGTGENFNPSYNGGDPGPDRVLIGQIETNDGKNGNPKAYSRFFCLVISHRGLVNNAFKVCNPSTG